MYFLGEKAGLLSHYSDSLMSVLSLTLIKNINYYKNICESMFFM